MAYDDAGPVVLPVNYVIDSDTVLFRTSPYSSLGQHIRTGRAAFEVDEIDDETYSGWSVLVRGRATFVESIDLPEAAARSTSWRECDGAQSLHVRITPRLISGRRLDRGSGASNQEKSREDSSQHRRGTLKPAPTSQNAPDSMSRAPWPGSSAG